MQSSPLVAPAIAPHESGAGWYAKVMLLLVTVDVVAITVAVLLTFRIMFSAGAHTLGVAGGVLRNTVSALGGSPGRDARSNKIPMDNSIGDVCSACRTDHGTGNGRLFAWTSGEFRMVIYPALWKGPQ